MQVYFKTWAGKLNSTRHITKKKRFLPSYPEKSHSRISSLEMICNRPEMWQVPQVFFFNRDQFRLQCIIVDRVCLSLCVPVCLSVYQLRVYPCHHLSPFNLESLNLDQNCKQHYSIMPDAICHIPKLCNNILHLWKYNVIINIPADECVAEMDVSKLASCIRHASPCIWTTM